MNRLPRKTDATGFAARTYCSSTKCTARNSENIDVLEEVVLIQEYAPVPAIHRIVRHFEHKRDIVVNLTFPYWKLVLKVTHDSMNFGYRHHHSDKGLRPLLGKY